ncbi:HAD-IC family P-type ATPase, partial [Spirillospora sp. NPDC029432]|uniref:HAD-IC family P-type ATPase n=1 Tax=Spirillospora sp. NPDC029432 TaxID=3154599 RepID=UPI003451A8C7
PVERHADHALPLALGGTAAGALLARSARRSLGVGLAALPKAAGAGRELFAAELGARLADRGVLPVVPGALRRLDRIDTVVLDAGVLLSDEPAVGEVTVVGDAGEAEVAGRVYALFDPAAPGQVREDGEWRLGPPGRVLPRGADGEPPDERALALVRGDEPQAFVSTARTAADEVNALVTAVRRAGLRLVTAGGEAELPGRPDARVRGGAELASSVRRLQSEGAGVLLVSADREALAAADVGVGLPGPGGLPSWGADLLVHGERAAAAAVIEAAGTARGVSELGVTLCRSGAGVGALLALTGPPGRAAGRAMSAVHGAAGVAMVQGAWRAREVMRREPAPAPPATPWHALPAEIVLERLGSRAEGLTDEEAGVRRTAAAAGSRPPHLTLPRAVGRELANPLTPVLAAGAAGAAAVGSPADALLVSAVMGLSGLVGGVQRRATERTLAGISTRSADPVRVLRGGTERGLDSDRLVRGDVLLLEAGSAVPADCRILTARGLEADESALTGESLPVAKDAAPTLARHVAERTCMLYEGTTIAAGEATAVVVAVGTGTESGRAMAEPGGPGRSGGVDARLKSITSATTPIAVGAAVAVTASGLIRGGALRRALSEGVNLAVASVPEGLPLLVSAAELAATRRLAGRGVYVRDPKTIEALGRVDVLCFDKTGTLTEGEIRLARVGDRRRDVRLDALDRSTRPVLAAALRATPPAGNGGHSHLTDAAVDAGAAAAGVGRGTGGTWHHVTSLPFEPSRSYHASLGRSRGRTVLCVKGAPETVLPRCTATSEGPLDDAGRRDVERRVEELAQAGHRVLAVAERRGGPARERLDDEDVAGLTFLGLLGLADTVRATAAPAVAALRDAGVHIVMLTGDHPATAAAIAGDLTGSGGAARVIVADEIDHLDDGALGAALEGVDAVARCTPAHKVRIVRAYQAQGRTVAMTGDGANDAAGIRLADVGIALGGRGTAAARDAAGLVVADDRLETIVSALVEGRAMWGSVREALAILVGGNLGEIGFTLLGSLVSGRSPLSARQMLLMNMLTDLAPALAIAVRAPSREVTSALLAEGPESSLGSALTRDIAQRAVVTTLGATAGWTAGRLTGPAVRARTIGLVALIGTQLAQTLLTGRRDRAVAVTALGSAVLLAAIVQTPGVGAFFGCVPLDPLGWATAAGAIAAAMLAGRYLPRPAAGAR